MKKITFSILLITGIFTLYAENPDNFVSAILKQHNIYRAAHGVPELSWNNDIQKFAQEWADKLASEDKMYHRKPNKFGENIYWISGGEITGDMPVEAWYNEIKDYNYSKPDFSMKTGHFTQVVWSDTTEVGCGKARSKKGGLYVVCNYSPPGNYMGQFGEKVPKKK